MGVAQVVPAVIIVASLARAFLGAPPRRSDGVAVAGWLAAGVVLLASVPFATPGVAALLSAGATICAAVAGWWLRAPADDDGGDADRAPLEPGPDWDAFDRLRDDWSRHPVA